MNTLSTVLPTNIDEVIAHLDNIVSACEVRGSRMGYFPAMYNRVGFVDVTALTEKVAADIDIAKNWKPGSLKDDGKRAGIGKNFQK